MYSQVKAKEEREKNERQIADTKRQNYEHEVSALRMIEIYDDEDSEERAGKR